MSPLRVGIAGYGIVGRKRSEFISAHPELIVVAVCDKTFETNSKLEDGTLCFTDPESLIRDTELDILFVCMSNDIAAEVTIMGLNHGLHVFCEKPPGRNVEEITQVREVEALHPHLKLKYGFNHRYHDSVKDALSLLKSGELGRVLNIRAVYGKSRIITFNQTDWRTKRELAGGGVLLDQGIHMVDIIRLFAGEFSEVSSFITNDFWHHDVEDNAYALMKSESGIIAMLHSSATEWRHRFRLEIALAKGCIVLGGILSGSKSYGAETLTVSYAAEGDNGDPKEITTKYNADPSWNDEILEFAEAILQDKPIESGTSQDALDTMKLVYAIYCADPEWKKKYNLSYLWLIR